MYASQARHCALQFGVIMLDVAAPDPAGDPGTLNSIPAQFLSPGFLQEGLRRRLRYMHLVAFHSPQTGRHLPVLYLCIFAVSSCYF